MCSFSLTYLWATKAFGTSRWGGATSRTISKKVKVIRGMGAWRWVGCRCFGCMGARGVEYDDIGDLYDDKDVNSGGDDWREGGDDDGDSPHFVMDVFRGLVVR